MGAHSEMKSLSTLRAYHWRGRLPIAGLVGFATILALQVPYPLLSDEGQRIVTIWSVVAFFCTSCAHAWWSRGLPAAVALVGVCVGIGFVAELIGSKTGLPFGTYDYTDVLGLRVFGVPAVVPLAWAMFGWLALLCARRVGGGWSGAAVGSLVLVAWDLFLDPQMIRLGAWEWRETAGPWLNAVPLVNSVGWFAVGLVMVRVLLAVVDEPIADRRDDLGWMLLGWTLFSETLLFAVFFDNPAVALVGTPSLGLVLLGVYRLGRTGSAG